MARPKRVHGIHRKLEVKVERSARQVHDIVEAAPEVVAQRPIRDRREPRQSLEKHFGSIDVGRDDDRRIIGQRLKDDRARRDHLRNRIGRVEGETANSADSSAIG